MYSSNKTDNDEFIRGMNDPSKFGLNPIKTDGIGLTDGKTVKVKKVKS